MKHFLQPVEKSMVEHIKDYIMSVMDDIHSLSEEEFKKFVTKEIEKNVINFILSKSFVKKVGKNEFKLIRKLIRGDAESIPISLEDVKILLPLKTQIKKFDVNPTLSLFRDFTIDVDEYLEFDKEVLGGRDKKYIEYITGRYFPELFD